MTLNEMQGIISTADKLFLSAAEASENRDWVTYFARMEEAEGALLYVQLHCVDAATCNVLSQLKATLVRHRELTVELMSKLYPEASA